MESSFLFLFVGIFIFIAKSLVANRSGMIQLITFLTIGFTTGTIIGIMESHALIPGLSLPWLSCSIIGVLSAILLYYAEKLDLFHQPENGFPFAKGIVFLIFLLYAFIIVFGYTFPKRWFIKREDKI
jgi:CBS domain containing-hemolysin-like protein